MRSAELANQPTELERMINTGVASTDMTLIYNIHGTPEDAIASVKHVKPDSVAFIECYSIRKAEIGSGMVGLPYEQYLNTLNELRLQHGKNDVDYQRFKEAIILSIDSTASEYIPENDSDFTLHSLVEIKELLIKDCLVFYADYRDLGTEQDNPEEVNGLHRRFLTLAQEASANELIGITGDSIGSTLRSLKSGVRAKMLKHNHREDHAVIRSLSVMGGLAALPADAMDLRRSEDGKINAYTIFGTAHARSLTHKFTDKGLQPTVTIVDSIAEHMYFDALPKFGYENYNRRVGHAALSNIAPYLTHEFILPAILDDTYSHLEFLNDASQEERLSFLVTCAHIQELLADGDRKTAEKEYLALLRSFMPQPIAFKPPKDQTIYAMPGSVHNTTSL